MKKNNDSEHKTSNISWMKQQMMISFLIVLFFWYRLFQGDIGMLPIVIFISGIYVLVLSITLIKYYIINRKLTPDEIKFREKWHYERRQKKITWKQMRPLGKFVMILLFPIAVVFVFMVVGIFELAWKGVGDDICYLFFNKHAVGKVEAFQKEDEHFYYIAFDEEVDKQTLYMAQPWDDFDRQSKIGKEYFVMFRDINNAHVVDKKMFVIENIFLIVACILCLFFVIFGKWIIPVLKYYYDYMLDHIAALGISHSN